MEQLTKKQKNIYDFIIDYTARNFFQPSLKEIAVKHNLKSHQAVMTHLKALEKKGYIKRTGESRAIIIKPFSLKSL